MNRKWRASDLLCGLGLLTAMSVAAEMPQVAGLRPDRRPEGAPLIERFHADEAWRAKATRGIAEPHTGLSFLGDQGAWYTPFDRPNQTGRYDIRRLYDDGNQRQGRRD